MIKEAIVLAGGNGEKIWPYAEIRNKVMIPISNEPIISYNVNSLIDLGVENIVVVASEFSSEIARLFKNNKEVTVVPIKQTYGNAHTLLAAKEYINGDKFAVFYGDTIISKDDIGSFIMSDSNTLLVSKLIKEYNYRNLILCLIDEGKEEVVDIKPYPRSNGDFYQIAGYLFDKLIFSELELAPQTFKLLSVGVMPKVEYYLESLIQSMIFEGSNFKYMKTNNLFLDVDKPWHILMANYGVNKVKTTFLKENILDENAFIDESANIDGFVKLGKNSKIGKGVKINGNIIVGDNTIIDNGAIIGDSVVIGDDCKITNYCLITDGSTIGNRCIVEHCTEVYTSVVMDHSYLYHYGEFYGVIGENTDIGAATVCGTLRFDDNTTIHKVKGRKEEPKEFGNAIFLGDYSRTGVNAMLMPGVKTGVYTVVGSGVLLQVDLPNNKCVFVKQELQTIDWGPEKYGY